MSKCASVSSIYSLAYPDDIYDDEFPYASLSPIHYSRYPSEEYLPSMSSSPFYLSNNHASSRIEKEIPKSEEEVGEVTLADIEDHSDEGQAMAHGHPGAPWFQWQLEGGQPGYEIQHDSHTFHCPYIHYGVYNGIPYELGTEGIGQPQFAHEMHVRPQSPFDTSQMEDKELDLFVKDVPFNFALEQALESLDDLGVLAEVACLWMIIARAPIYTELASEVKDLSDAIHKFQQHFNEKTQSLVDQLKATKRRMEAARLPSCIQAALVDLAKVHELKGRYYWLFIPRVPENPNHVHHGSFSTLSTENQQGSNPPHKISAINNLGKWGCMSSMYKAAQRAYNLC